MRASNEVKLARAIDERFAALRADILKETRLRTESVEIVHQSLEVSPLLEATS